MPTLHSPLFCYSAFLLLSLPSPPSFILPFCWSLYLHPLVLFSLSIGPVTSPVYYSFYLSLCLHPTAHPLALIRLYIGHSPPRPHFSPLLILPFCWCLNFPFIPSVLVCLSIGHFAFIPTLLFCLFIVPFTFTVLFREFRREKSSAKQSAIIK